MLGVFLLVNFLKKIWWWFGLRRKLKFVLMSGLVICYVFYRFLKKWLVGFMMVYEFLFFVGCVLLNVWIFIIWKLLLFVLIVVDVLICVRLFVSCMNCVEILLIGRIRNWLLIVIFCGNVILMLVLVVLLILILCFIFVLVFV